MSTRDEQIESLLNLAQINYVKIPEALRETRDGREEIISQVQEAFEGDVEVIVIGTDA